MKGKREFIEVLYAIMDRNGNYSKLVGTSIYSLLENAKDKVRLHIFHDGSIKGRNRERFELLAEKYACPIVFYNVREILPDVLREAKEIFSKAVEDSRFTEAALYRILAPQILSEDIKRVIYLDADTLVNIDIAKLWREKVGNGLSAVREVDIINHFNLVRRPPTYPTTLAELSSSGITADNCFNSGVLLMDLVKMRSMGNILLEGLKALRNITDETNFYDQLILNYYFAKDMIPLPAKYNLLQYWDRISSGINLIEGIYHYSAHTLKMNDKDPRDTMYWDYFLKTPWADGVFFCRFNNERENLYIRRSEESFKKLQRMISICAERKLVLAYTKEYEKEVKDAFSSKACYLCLGEKETMNLKLDYDVDGHFYIFFVPNYAKVNALLSQAGLEEGVEYMNGEFILKDKSDIMEMISIQQYFEKL